MTVCATSAGGVAIVTASISGITMRARSANVAELTLSWQLLEPPLQTFTVEESAQLAKSRRGGYGDVGPRTRSVACQTGGPPTITGSVSLAAMAPLSLLNTLAQVTASRVSRRVVSAVNDRQKYESRVESSQVREA
jgi:hypothetical protein